MLMIKGLMGVLENISSLHHFPSKSKSTQGEKALKLTAHAVVCHSRVVTGQGRVSKIHGKSVILVIGQ